MKGLRGPATRPSCRVALDADSDGIVFDTIGSARQQRICGLSFAGTLGANGMNSYGFALIINKLYGKDWRVGVPYPFIVREALDQVMPGRSLSMIIGAERGGSMHYLCADAAGILYPLETTATQWDLLDVADGGLYVHTNHFSGPRFRHLECRDFRVFNAHTVVRFQRARQMFKRIGSVNPVESYLDILGDEHNYPLCINTNDDGDVQFATVAKAAFDTGTMRTFSRRAARLPVRFRTCCRVPRRRPGGMCGRSPGRR